MKQTFKTLIVLVILGLVIEVARLDREISELKSDKTARARAREAAEALRQEFASSTNHFSIFVMRDVNTAIALAYAGDPTEAMTKIQAAQMELLAAH